MPVRVPQECQARSGAEAGRLAGRAPADVVLGRDAAAVSVAAPGRPAGDRLRVRRSSGWAERRRGKLRTGADTWMRHALAVARPGRPLALPLLLVLILLGWQVVSYRDWRFSPGILAGMVVESLVWAVVLWASAG